MRLLIEHNGVVEEVLPDIDGFDLSQTLARAVVAEEIRETIRRIKVQQDMERPNTDKAIERLNEL